MHIRNTHIGDDSVTETVNGMFRSTFVEDKPVLEAIQRQEGKPQAISTVELAIDRGPLAYRARIKELVALEMEQDTTDGDSSLSAYRNRRNDLKPKYLDIIRGG